jgi:hypothetical protein
MEPDSSDNQTKKQEYRNRQNRFVSNASDVLQSIWVRYNVCSSAKNNGLFHNNRFYLLFHFNIFLYFILHQSKKI